MSDLVPVEKFTQFQKSYSEQIKLLGDMKECLWEDVASVSFEIGTATGCRCLSCHVYIVKLGYSVLNKAWRKGSDQPLFIEGDIFEEDEDLNIAFYKALEQVKKIKEQH